jgi:hypothetical protein|tara:strand:- start:958 stop:1176 length:219 start_codon:yes stop_codon:yes gene_type:complete
MEKPVPDFAIFQNDRTRVSSVWVKGSGEWRSCPPEDFKALEIITSIIRNSTNPEKTLVMIAKIIAKTNESDL